MDQFPTRVEPVAGGLSSHASEYIAPVVTETTMEIVLRNLTAFEWAATHWVVSTGYLPTRDELIKTVMLHASKDGPVDRAKFLTQADPITLHLYYTAWSVLQTQGAFDPEVVALAEGSAIEAFQDETFVAQREALEAKTLARKLMEEKEGMARQLTEMMERMRRIEANAAAAPVVPLPVPIQPVPAPAADPVADALLQFPDVPEDWDAQTPVAVPCIKTFLDHYANCEVCQVGYGPALLVTPHNDSPFTQLGVRMVLAARHLFPGMNEH